jgi:putative hydrolase of the HAD superfamily
MRMPTARRGLDQLGPSALDSWGCEGVLFDYGHTLVTFDYPTAELLAVLRELRPRLEDHLGRPAPDSETILRDVLLPLEEYVRAISEDEVVYMDVYREAWKRAGLELPDSLLYDILDAEQRCWDRAVQIEPDTFAVLSRLASRGCRRGICSNAPFPPEMMHRQLRSNGIADHVEAAIFSSEVGRRKPSPEVYRAALAAIGTRPERTLFVGNRVREDYAGPTALGMRALIVTAHAEEDSFDGIPTVAALGDLLALL